MHRSSRSTARAAPKPPPTGHVRKTAGHLDGAVAAAAFAGLPQSIAHPKQLIEPLRQVGLRLPFPREALDTLSLLFDYTRLDDWQPGGRPLVFPGNAELAGCLGISDRTVRNHLRALQAAGIIHIERGPGNRRTPVRNGTGAIVEAYGIDLSPMIEAHARAASLALELRRRRDRLKAHMRAISVAVQEIRTAADAVAVIALEGSGPAGCSAALAELESQRAAAEAQAGQARRLFERDPLLDEADQAAGEVTLARAAAALTRLAGEANVTAMTILSPLEKEESGSPETGFREDSTNLDSTRYSASQEKGVAVRSGLDRQAHLPGLAAEPDFVPEPADHAIRLSPRHVLAVYPGLAEILTDYLLVPEPERMSQGELVEAARLLALRLGVSEWCWRTGCNRHGRVAAALAAVISVAKPNHEIRKSRAAFLAGMLLRPPGELHVLQSFHALRKRNPGEGRGGDG